MDKLLLDARNLTVEFKTEQGVFTAVRNVGLRVKKGEILGVVGESGSGKTVTSLSIMGLLPRNGRVAEGASIRLDGEELVGKRRRELRKIRGKQIAMIFQDPMSSLDPLYRCGPQIEEALRWHEDMPRPARRKRSLELLEQVGIHSPEQYWHAYPHELSGGMCQRVMIAIALACDPLLLIADEPTTALDVTVQARILQLLKYLRASTGMSVLVITHDLGVIAETADRVAVMYGGEVMEEGEVCRILEEPLHPYTRGLLASVPQLDQSGGTLQSIEGVVPDISQLPAGCPFSTRCALADAACRDRKPPARRTGGDHTVRCWKTEERGTGDDG